MTSFRGAVAEEKPAFPSCFQTSQTLAAGLGPDPPVLLVYGERLPISIYGGLTQQKSVSCAASLGEAGLT